MKQTS